VGGGGPELPCLPPWSGCRSGHYEEDVLKQLAAYVNANEMFFAETGVSGGAEAAAKSGVDAPLINGLGAT
jgi:hypothetical protein